MDIGQLGALLAVAFVIYRLTDAIIKPLAEVANLWWFWQPDAEEADPVAAKAKAKAVAIKRILDLWPQYLTILIGSGATAFTRLNAFPQFYELGQPLTCLVAGLGPSFIFDLVKSRPSLPQSTA